MRLTLAGTDIDLLPERAVFLPETGDLVVADVHLGKSATFRARGIPVPEGETTDDLERLAQLAARTQARRILVAGDLVHAPEALRHDLPERLARWIADCPAELVLIAGNHDRRAGLRHLRCPAFPDLETGTLRIVHDPCEASGPSIAGHLHPSIRLPTSPRRSHRHPCFWLQGETLVLPAFGTFTGTHPVRPEEADRVFIPLASRVREIPRGWR
ncbi:ligase-associated DNA damage response endonuclease PdeM [Haloferula sargassicola]|uniref:Calcineurin-like phosphoesterase domain-containing protein n=1 Tax=Haloferula sargassicola TaxID=490096 RepID=A0ABP9UMB1_9BACT